MAIFKPTIPPIGEETRPNTQSQQGVPRQVAAFWKSDESHDLIERALREKVITTQEVMETPRRKLVSYLQIYYHI